MLAGLLVVALLAFGVAWVLDRDSGPTGPAAEPWTLEPYQGLGAWVDAFDWSQALGGETPVVGEDDLAAMADLGIQTVYLQTSHLGVPDQTVLEQERVEGLIDAAHEHGLSVVAWYLPTLEDIDVDLERLLASAELDVDGLAVDIESTTIEDPVERNARLAELNDGLRAALPDQVLGGITLSAVHVQEVNPDFWPDFPWVDIAETYDVVLPMTYWSIRLPEWQDGNRYVGENIDRIRAATGDPDLPIHVIGGIADGATVAEVQGMLEAIEARDGVLGASLYDWATSSPPQWTVLGALGDRNPAGPDGP
ncbi:hypothetical protein [Rhabdothermincola salaria]|uniref:hypothetical protein n=1 Tax=Rhabdothermincola salaria TaxID=2903142 RepID=UPI001E4172FE|nr:hypothetical protein [Rhabdothermincola salaria]MCD9622847.1 hypothetical protein [Rhabdothermincola salaria]